MDDDRALIDPLADPGPAGPLAQLGIGLVAPFDFAIDREIWRWVPDDVSLHITRTPYSEHPVNVDLAHDVAEPAMIREATRSLTAVEPRAVGYLCTSGSFIEGLDGERDIRLSMLDGGAAAAVTTSGALLTALTALDLDRVAIATPYIEELTDCLRLFLRDAGVTTVASEYLGLEGRIWTVPYATTYQLIQQADHPDAQAVFVSCTNLPTYDVIADAEQALGKPVLTANQVTIWAALRAIGHHAVGPRQRLLDAL